MRATANDSQLRNWKLVCKQNFVIKFFLGDDSSSWVTTR